MKKKGGTNKMTPIVTAKADVFYLNLGIYDNQVVGLKTLSVCVANKRLKFNDMLEEDINCIVNKDKYGCYYIRSQMVERKLYFLFPLRCLKKKITAIKSLAKTSVNISVGLHIDPFSFSQKSTLKPPTKIVEFCKKLSKQIKQNESTASLYLTLPLRVRLDDIIFFDGKKIYAQQLYFLTEEEFADYLTLTQKLLKASINKKVIKKTELAYASLLAIIKTFSI